MEERVQKITNYDHSKNVLYLMQRDHRIQDNYSLLLSQNLANQSKTGLYIGTNLSKIKKNDLQNAFILEGLKEFMYECNKLNIHFNIIYDIKDFVLKNNIDCVVTEFSPLREVLEYQNEIKEYCENNSISLFICDSHNIVPCRVINTYIKNSRGVKSRLYKQWDKYFKSIKKIEKHKYNDKESLAAETELNGLIKKSIKNYSLFKGGYTEGMKALEFFIN